MNKKGDESLLMNIAYLTIIVLFIFIFLVWIGGMATGRVTKTQILSKEIALILDSARPGTEISIAHEPGKISIDTDKKEVSVLINEVGNVYGYFSQYKIIPNEVNNTFMTIKIEK